MKVKRKEENRERRRNIDMIVTTENIAEKDFCYGRKCTKNARKSKKL